MQSDPLYDTDLIYPGSYLPLFDEQEAQSALQAMHEGETAQPPVNITEWADVYKIQIALPGINREDILVHVDGNVLSLCVYHQESEPQSDKRVQLHEFDYKSFQRHIVLPDTADMAFTSAEYNAGILNVYAHKATHPSPNQHVRIAVY